MTAIADVDIWVSGARGDSHKKRVAILTGRTDEQYLRLVKCAKVALTAGLGNTYAFAWQNPEDNQIIIYEIIVNITTQATAAATLDIDVVASAAAHSDTIFDALTLNSAGVYSSLNVAQTGGNGDEKPHIVDENGGTNDYVTGYEAAAQSMAALVGNVYIFYTEI